MAGIRIQLSGVDGTFVIVLEGPHITIGKSVVSTIQIEHRTIEMHHAELIEEGGHYRLHDFDSRNGVFVNGQRVANYLLRESCKLSFGEYECDYLLEIPSTLCDQLKRLPFRLWQRHFTASGVADSNRNDDIQGDTNAVRNGRPRKSPNGISGLHVTHGYGPLETQTPLREALAQREKEVAQLRECFMALQSVREDIRPPLDTLKLRCGTPPHWEPLESLRRESSVLIESHESLESEVAQLNAELQLQRSEYSQLKAQCDALELTLKEREHEIKILRRQVPTERAFDDDFVECTPQSPIEGNQVVCAGMDSRTHLEDELESLGFIVRPINRQ